ncbi:MAG TPA: DUF4340 domain-containing protein [Candidatus Scybalocola faecavium]|nr:DUF4340 domain-containing protein [Candidatus Scybalocola faecavium]
MKNKQTVKLAAALIVLVAAVGIYFGMSMWNRAEEEQEAAQDSSIELLSITSDDVTAFSYEYEGETYAFVKEDGTWYYEGDKDFPVKQTSITGKLSSAVSTTASREIEISEDKLADYGLDDPVNTISITDSEGNETVFEIGDSNATTGEYYCRLNSSNKVYMISSTLNTMMSFDLYSVVDMEDFPTLAVDSIKEVTVNDGNEVRSLDSSEDYIAFSALSTLTYDSHVDYDCEDLSQYGLDAPQYVVTIGYLEETEDETESETSETEAESETQAADETSDTEETEETEETYDPADLTTYVLSIGNATEDGSAYYVRLGNSTEVNLISADNVETIIAADEETEASTDETEATEASAEDTEASTEETSAE